MKEKRHAATEIDGLSEYERFLLDALLELAAEEAGKPLSAAAKRAVISAFLENLRARD